MAPTTIPAIAPFGNEEPPELDTEVVALAVADVVDVLDEDEEEELLLEPPSEGKFSPGCNIYLESLAAAI
jgi:hypothetical protein